MPEAWAATVSGPPCGLYMQAGVMGTRVRGCVSVQPGCGEAADCYRIT